MLESGVDIVQGSRYMIKIIEVPGKNWIFFNWFPKVIAEHLFHEGKFAVGEKFLQETGIEEPADSRKLFESVHTVLKEVWEPLAHMKSILRTC